MGDANGAMDCDVDIIGPNGGASCSKSTKIEDPDATECSSSFGDTLSGSDDDARPSEISDIEVDSPFCRYPVNGHVAALMDAAVADNSDRLLKKKKVTDHWRKYISPLMWRCQWLELRMNDLQSQVSKYDRQLAILKHEKELQTKMIELDCSSSRSVPFSSHCCRKTMKRRRRNRKEDKANISSYISNHTILSYYEKTTEADGHSLDDDENSDETTKGNNDADWLLGKGSDFIVEHILLSIQSVQDRIFSLRSNLKKAMANKSKGVTLKINTRVNGTQSSNFSPGKRKFSGVLERLIEDTSDCDMDDADMPESALSSYGEANNMDIFESTMSLLSAEDPHRIRELRQNYEDVLIDNQVAEEGYQNFEVISHPSKRLRVSVKRETGAHSENESVAPTASTKQEETQEEGTTSFNLQGAIFKPFYTGKRRGRRSKLQRRGSSSTSALIWSTRIRKKRQF